MSSKANKKVTLKGQAAIDLWQKGKEEWNQYVEDNPESDIHFFKCDFTKFNHVSFEKYKFPNGMVSFTNAQFGNEGVNFRGAKFGNGTVRFIRANFGDGDVDFRRAEFGNGGVNFHGAKFGNGTVRFIRTNFGDGDVRFSDTSFGNGPVFFVRAEFGDGDIRFSDTSFGNGPVYFARAEFGDGDVDFKRANFGDGDVDFQRAKFGDGDVDFTSAVFGNGKVLFVRTKFGDGDADFKRAVFGNGPVYFARARFGDGDVDFTNAEFCDGKLLFNNVKFGDGDVRFHGAVFGEEDLNFGYIEIGGSLVFNNLKNSHLIKSLNFNFSTFNGSVNIEDNEFNCIPDFTNTKLANQLNLEHFQTRPNKKNHSNLLIPVFVFFYKALWGRTLKYSYKKKSIKLARKFTIFNKTIISDKKDISRIRRLKELAETNKHHKLALDLHIEEIKSSRWIETTSKRTLFAEYLFQIFGDFGRSLQRPFIGLISTWVAFTPIYFYVSNMGGELLKKLSDSAVFSFAQMLPLAPISRDAKKETLKSLYNDDMPNWIIGIAGFQSLISVALVFLIGLALRNRFRI